MQVYSAKTDRKVSMFMDAFHAVHEVFGWEHAVVWWHAADATLLRECWEEETVDCVKADEILSALTQNEGSTGAGTGEI